MGERKNKPLRLELNRRLKLEFHGAKVTSDAGLLAYRELDGRLGLTAMAGDKLVEPRHGKNTLMYVLGILLLVMASLTLDVSAATDKTGEAAGTARRVINKEFAVYSPLFATKARTLDPVSIARRAWKGYISKNPGPWKNGALRYHFDCRVLPWPEMKHHSADGSDVAMRTLEAHVALHRMLGKEKQNDPVEARALKYIEEITDPESGMQWLDGRPESNRRCCPMAAGMASRNLKLMYKLTGDEKYKDWSLRILNSLQKYAYTYDRPGVGLTASYAWNAYNVGEYYPDKPTGYLHGGNLCYITGWNVWAFSEWYEETKDPKLLEFAMALVNRTCNTEHDGNDGAFFPDGSFGGNDPKLVMTWHVHSHTHILPGFVHLGEQLIKAGRRKEGLRMVARARKTFEWLYDPARNPDAGSMTGWLGEWLMTATGWQRKADAEGCTTGDIVQTATMLGEASRLDPKLAHLVDYYDRAEQIYRGQVMASIFQVTPRYREVVKESLEQRIAKEITTVLGWQDQSSYGNHCETLIGEPKKVERVDAINNQPSIHFDKKSYALLKNSAALRLKTFSVVAVLSVKNGKGGSYFSNYDAPINWGKGMNLQITPDRKVYFFTTSGTEQTYDRMWSDRAMSEGFHIITATYDATNKVIYADGELIGKKVSKPLEYGNGTVAAIGALREFGEFFDGDLVELIVYDKVERKQQMAIETYLGKKYKIPITAESEMKSVGKPVLWFRADQGFNTRTAEEVARLKKEAIEPRYKDAMATAARMEGRLLGLCGFPGWVNNLKSPMDPELPGIDMMGCCGDAVIRAAYAIWDQTVTGSSGETRVNMAFNRKSPLVDVISCLPHRGEINVIVKEARKVLVRVSYWTEKAKAKAYVDKKPIPLQWEGSYVVFDKVTTGQHLTVTYPLRIAEVKEPVNGINYTEKWRGNTIVDISPAAKQLPMFERPELDTERMP